MKDNIKIEYNCEKVRLYTIDPLGLIVIVNAPPPTHLNDKI